MNALAMALLGFKPCGAPLQWEHLERAAEESASNGNHQMRKVIYSRFCYLDKMLNMIYLHDSTQNLAFKRRAFC